MNLSLKEREEGRVIRDLIKTRDRLKSEDQERRRFELKLAWVMYVSVYPSDTSGVVKKIETDSKQT